VPVVLVVPVVSDRRESNQATAGSRGAEVSGVPVVLVVPVVSDRRESNQATEFNDRLNLETLSILRDSSASQSPARPTPPS
jgi:hypothetical protein